MLLLKSDITDVIFYVMSYSTCIVKIFNEETNHQSYGIVHLLSEGKRGNIVKVIQFSTDEHRKPLQSCIW